MKGAIASGRILFSRGCFNPRTREGCDLLPRRLPVPDDVSIHAPVKGAMAEIVEERAKEEVSIHAPVKGAMFIPHGSIVY